MSVSENDGQTVRAAFVLREQPLLREGPLACYVTAGRRRERARVLDDQRSVQRRGHAVGAGVDMGEDWAVIAGRAGMYIFDGGEPIKISQEIQPLWDTDQLGRRANAVGARGHAQQAHPVRRADRHGDVSRIAFWCSTTAACPAPAKSNRSARSCSRRCRENCTPWAARASGARGTSPRIACALAERSDGTAQVFLGNGVVGGAGNGKIYQLSDTQFSDDGAAINSYYTTYFFLSHDLEQTYSSALAPKTFRLSDAVRRRGRELEPLRLRRQRSVSHGAHAAAAVLARRRKISSCRSTCSASASLSRWARTTPGAWFKLERFIPSLLPDPWAPVRGGN